MLMLKALTCLPWSPQTPFNPGSWSQLVLFLATFCYLNTEFAQTGNDYTWYGIQKIYKTVIIQSPSLHSPPPFLSRVTSCSAFCRPFGRWSLLSAQVSCSVSNSSPRSHLSSDILACSLGIWTTAFSKSSLLGLQCQRKVMYFLCFQHPQALLPTPQTLASPFLLSSTFSGSCWRTPEALSWSPLVSV